MLDAWNRENGARNPDPPRCLVLGTERVVPGRNRKSSEMNGVYHPAEPTTIRSPQTVEVHHQPESTASLNPTPTGAHHQVRAHHQPKTTTSRSPSLARAHHQPNPQPAGARPPPAGIHHQRGPRKKILRTRLFLGTFDPRGRTFYRPLCDCCAWNVKLLCMCLGLLTFSWRAGAENVLPGLDLV